MPIFEGETADEVWLKAAEYFRRAELPRQDSRVGPTKEVLGSVFVIRNPRQRWVHSRNPAINPAFALAEVIWIINGRRDSEFLNFWNPALPKLAGRGDLYHGAYGYRLRHNFKFDQLERAYRALKNNPNTRQIVLQITDPRIDAPNELGEPTDPDIPCNVCAFLKIRDNALHWTQVLRSNDLFLGVPYNFVQFTCLQEILAGWLDIRVGVYRHYADSLHLYESDLQNANSSQSCLCPDAPGEIRLGRDESESIFGDAATMVCEMIQPSLSERRLEAMISNMCSPFPVNNWLRVISAECARRHRWGPLSETLILDGASMETSFDDPGKSEGALWPGAPTVVVCPG